MIAAVSRRVRDAWGLLSIRELGARFSTCPACGPLFEFLKRRVGTLTCSEYFDDVEPGQWRDGVQCQDFERLTFPDASFDLCTSTKVFEHVPDDVRGFGEIRGVLKPQGRFIFTVPLSDNAATTTRAERIGGELRHLLPPEYHGDSIRGQGRILVYRDYRRDIVDRLRLGGFAGARIVDADDARWWELGRNVIVAET